MAELMNALGIGGTIASAFIILFLLLNVVGEICTKLDKIVPSFMKVITTIKKKRQNKQQKEKEQEETLKLVKQLLEDVNSHYSKDNIAKRDSWMNWVNARADVYDQSIESIKEELSAAVASLTGNTHLTEKLFIERCRDRIIDFAEKASDYELELSHEQFRRIEKIYDEYERFLAEHNEENGQVDVAHELIQDGYKYRIKNKLFIEDRKGYPKR